MLHNILAIISWQYSYLKGKEIVSMQLITSATHQEPSGR